MEKDENIYPKTSAMSTLALLRASTTNMSPEPAFPTSTARQKEEIFSKRSRTTNQAGEEYQQDIAFSDEAAWITVMPLSLAVVSLPSLEPLGALP